MPPYGIVVADDHILFRQGLRKILEDTDYLEVIGEAGNWEELRTLLGDTKRSTPNMIILDMSMPGLHGMDIVRELRKDYSGVKILVLSMHKEYLHQALLAGASGYLLKEDADKELFSAIENIQQGRIHISPSLAKALSGDSTPSPEPLTAREKEVFHLIAEGRANKEIAKLLFISIRTVESHRASIIRKLGLKGTANLVRYAFEKKHI